MPKFIEGALTGKEVRVCIIVARFNSLVTERLLEGAIDGLVRSGIGKSSIEIVRTPGAFEIPGVARKVVNGGKYGGIICLGAVVRGETPHFDYVSAEAIKGIATISMNSDVPVIMGVLTTDTMDQALDRAGAKVGNKGFDAARNLIEMINLYGKL
jgi:6,7-dimethyl-8-ribityllumazine synthase